MAILEDLRVEYKPGSKVKLLGALNDYLIQQMQENQNVVLIVDEAQNLTPSVLEEVRMLSNLETDTEKLIQIVLLGQPELREKLKLRHLKQFKQRIALHYHIYPLTKDETRAYIFHRLGVVATNGTIQSLFSPEALDVVYEFSQGIPRLINYACDNALLSGFVYEKTSIDKELVMEVVRESHLMDGGEQTATNKHCCSECGQFESCEVKWNRGLRGEEQVCCDKCVKYSTCH
jgi:general secretion pathway protein A